MIDDLMLELPISLGHYHLLRGLPNATGRVLACAMGSKTKVE
jgi:hypothetical protein